MSTNNINVNSDDIDKSITKKLSPITKKIITSTKPKEHQEITKSKDSHESKEITKSKESNEGKEITKSKESHEAKEITKSKESHEGKEITKSKESHEAKESQEAKGGNDEILLDTSKIVVKNKKSLKKVNVSANNLFNDEDIDFREILLNYDFTKNKTPPKITKYEKALLIGKRAKQIEEGANPNVKVLAGQSAIEIAEEELRQRSIPLLIKRPIGNMYEYWRPRDMEVLMD